MEEPQTYQLVPLVIVTGKEHLLPPRNCGKQTHITLFAPHHKLMSRKYYHPHFTDRKTEVYTG